jgi:tetratricopeptide (TPR) repeat protein
VILFIDYLSDHDAASRPARTVFMTGRLLRIVSLWFALAACGLPARAQTATDEQAREAEWRRLFGEGIAAFQRRDEDGAIEKWEAANRAYDRPEGYNNIAVILEGRGEYGRAASMYRQALAVLSRMRAPLDSERNERLATRRDVHQGLLGAGEELFRQGKSAEAVEALQALTAADPTNRDAWHTLGLALYKLERWEDLLPVARRSVELDPLSNSARTLLANVSKRQNAPDEQKGVLATLPVYVEGIQMVRGADRVTLRGMVTGNRAAAGSEVRLDVTLYDVGDVVGNHTVTLTAPPRDRAAPFVVNIPIAADVTGFSYRWLE